MADPGRGLERSIEAIGYSPIPGTDRGIADLIPQSLTATADSQLESHPELAALVRHGAARMETGNELEAEEWFRKALEFADRTVGTDHPDLILALNGLTRIYLGRSAYAAAEPLLLRLLEMKRSKGDDHPEVATVLASLGTVRQALGFHESAEQLWRRVLEIRERTLAPNHFAIATALEHFGDACAARGNIGEALAAFQRAQTIRERTLGSDHVSLRRSRERIADLQLQASDESMEFSAAALSPPTHDRFRLRSGEPLALSAHVLTPSAHERAPAPTGRRSKGVIHEQLADAPAPRSIPMDAEPAQTTFNSPLEALPYRAALESIREEFAPRERRSLTERGSAIVASATEFLGKRQVVAASVVIVIALLVTVVATGARGWGEIDPTPAPETELSSNGLAAVVAPTGPAVSTPDPSALFGSAAANVGSKTTEQRSRVTDDRNASKKVTPQKAEPQKKITIPKFSTALMSQVDSVASRAATSSRPAEAITFQPLPSPLGSGRTNFGYNEPSGAIAPQRAKLVGEMPSPRVPPDALDIGGTVRVRFTVDTEGRPVMSTLAVETSPSPLLTAAVRSTIAGIRFDPARTGGADSRAVTDVVRVGFQFVPRNR